MDNGVGINCENSGGVGWKKAKGENSDDCNNINKILNIKIK